MNLDPAKLLVILMVALIVLGPERLPRAARQAGAVWRELSKIRDQVTDEVRSAFPTDDLPKIPRIPNPTRAVSGFLSGLGEPTASAGTAHESVDEGSEGVAPLGPAKPLPGGTMAPFGIDDPSMN